MTRLHCTNCAHEEFTAAPRHFRGDPCTDCGEGTMLDNPMPREEA